MLSAANAEMMKKGKRGRPRKQPETKGVDSSSKVSIDSNPSIKRAEMNLRDVEYNTVATEHIVQPRESKPVPVQEQHSEIFHHNGEKHPLVEAKANYESMIPSNISCEIQTEDSSHQNGSETLVNSDIKILEADFASKSVELKQIITQLQKILTDYPSNPNKNGAAATIANQIQDCLIRLSIESLSPQELADYLSNNMGKLLFVLYSLLEEFEKYSHQTSQVLNPAVTQ